ncbi:hypothetical protein MRX96_055100 [Rhipicephalus microplus]
MTGIESDSGTVTGKRPRDEGKKDKGTTAASPDEPPAKTTPARRPLIPATAKHFVGAQDGGNAAFAKLRTEITPPPNTTPSAPTLRRHAPLPRLPAEYFKIIFRPVGGLDLHTTTHGVLLKTLCNLDIIDYEAVHTADRVRINPYNNSHTVSTPFKPRARLYLCASELHLGTISYSLRAYMAAPDDALHGVIYNAVISQTQDEISSKISSR